MSKRFRTLSAASVWACSGLAFATQPAGPAAARPAAASPITGPATASAKDPLFWVDGEAGLGLFRQYAVRDTGFGGYADFDRFVFGVRQRYFQGFSSVHHGRETGALAGYMFDRNAWAAAGLSSIRTERRDLGSISQRSAKVGLPLEIVYTPHFANIGLELRLEGDVNTSVSIVGLELGLRLGMLR